MELDYKIQTYDWGKKGNQSKVATLHANINENFKIDENTSYSELWIGTHVNGPSSLKNGTLLSTLISKQPDLLGENVRKQFCGELPFLFKILSVDKALSIQAHPAKEHAEELHKNHPDIYKDPNHKPELAIALTPFEALCGFRPLTEINYFLQNIPELKELLSSTKILEKFESTDTNLLREAFKAVLTSPKTLIAEQLKSLLERFKSLDEKTREKHLAPLIEKLSQQYPNDVGCFVVYFLNYLKLEPSQAIYLAANVPHAYLYGDCVECMACSDNVVRAGLTPKLIDVETLCSMLLYKGQTPQENLFQPIVEDSYTKIFKPPVPDFAVVQIKVPASLKAYKLIKRSSASTLLIVEGRAKLNDIELKPGSALFVSANELIEVKDIEEDLIIYQGLANV